MLRGLPFPNVLGLWSVHSCSSPSGSGPPESSCSWVSSYSSVPPHSPASLYDACVLMSGVRDARDAMLMQMKT